MDIKIENVSKRFGKFQALNDISLEVKEGEFIALLGPSGSGKTTLLRIIGGLEDIDSGNVLIKGEALNLIPWDRKKVGFVFQHYALFRHMNVFENIAFGLNVLPFDSRPTKEEIKEKVLRLLEFVHLQGFSDKYPSQLSGGQKQRVALARVLAVSPKIMLLDEPFGALDSKVRKDLRRWLRKMHDEMKITTLFVTHDQEEAMEIADRVAIVNEGRIVQIGTPEDLWSRPKSAFVFDFLGNTNIFWGLVKEDKIIELYQKENKGAEKILARPFDTLILKEKPEEDKKWIACRINHLNPASALVNIELEDGSGNSYQASISREKFKELGINSSDFVWISPSRFRIFIA